jgi:hypothetical protein
MDKPPQDNQENLELNAFRAEIAKAKENKLRSPEESGSETHSHLENCDPTELGEEEMILYKKWRSKNLTQYDLDEFIKKNPTSKNKNRGVFYEYIANMLAGENLTRDLKKWIENKRAKGKGKGSPSGNA